MKMFYKNEHKHDYCIVISDRRLTIRAQRTTWERELS